jgi:hypothetical protein
MTLDQYRDQYGRPLEKARGTVRTIALKRRFGDEEVEDQQLESVEMDLDLEELGVRIITSAGTANLQFFVYEPGRFDDWLVEHVDLKQPDAGDEVPVSPRDMELLLYCGQILLDTKELRTRDGQVKTVTDTFRDELTRILDKVGEKVG